VAEGNGMFVFSILFAVTVRLVYFFYLDPVNNGPANGYLWKPVSFLFGDQLVSLISGSVFTVGLAILSAHINTAYVFIRRKTILAPAVIILLFSGHPQLILMSDEYIGVLFMLVIISVLFGAYNSNTGKQIFAFKVSFILALGSLFTPVLLIYLPVLWIALGMMRCFNFKSLLASFLGIFVLYFPAFSFYLFTDSLDVFLKPFASVNTGLLEDFPFFRFNIGNWAVLIFSVVLLAIIISNNYINRHKDKIKIRAYLGLLTFTTMYSMLACLFLNIDSTVYVFIALGTGAFLLSHFFSLVERKEGVFLFCFSMFFYILVCLSPFLPL
jgi:hypothetical protein